MKEIQKKQPGKVSAQKKKTSSVHKKHTALSEKEVSRSGQKVSKSAADRRHAQKTLTDRERYTHYERPAQADYMDFVPRKMTEDGAEAAVLKSSAKTSGKKRDAAVARKKSVSYGRKKKKGGIFAGFDMMDRVIAATGLLVVLVAIITAGIYTGAQSAQKQVEAMAEVGVKLEQIGIAGEGVFTAVADARLAAIEAAEYAQEYQQQLEGNYEEKELDTKLNVGLKLTSVHKDLKIKFTNKSSGKLIGNQPFEVSIEGPEKLTQADGDEDGIIYISSLKPGEYKVTITAPEEIDGNKVKGVSSVVTVKDKIVYQKIDVVDEVKTEAQIDASKEDTGVKVEVEEVIKDTVEWVESSKTAVGQGSVSYVEVKKADIPAPSATASAGFARIAASSGYQDPSAVFVKKCGTGGEEAAVFMNEYRKVITARNESLLTAGHSQKAYALTLLSEQSPGKQTSGEQNTRDVTVTDLVITGPATANVNETVTLNAAVTMSDNSSYTGEIAWSSNVTGSGPQVTVTSAQAGAMEVTATVGDKSASHTVTFNAPVTVPTVTGVTITGPATAKVNESVSLTAAVTMSDGSAYTGDIVWSGAASGTGNSMQVTSAAAGEVKVTAAAGEKSATHTVTFSEDKVKVTAIKLDAAELTLKVGESKTLKATVEPGNASEKGVEWTSSDSSIAAVDANGAVKAVAAGTVQIKAAAKDGSNVSAECKVTVQAVEGVSVSMEAPGTMTVGQEKTLKLTTKGDVDTSKTVFTSSDTKLATVDNSGKIKALASGKVTVTVTVTDKNGKTASASGELQITSAEVSIKLSPASASVKVGQKVTISAEVTTTGNKGLTWSVGDQNLAKIVSSSDTACEIEALKAGTVSVTAVSKEKQDSKAVFELKIESNIDMTAALKDSAGRQLYYKEGETYKAATVADYYKYDVFYRQQDSTQYLYTGWQNLDGKRFYFDKTGKAVTGDHIIQGVQYSFNSDGSLVVNGSFGIDVSKHNGNIDWNAVKAAGVDFVIIRCGYRGSATGVLVEDPKFKTNIQGAIAAGLKVGIYFFSQAVNEVEAVEEASMTLSLINKYKITYPVYIDVEAANGRADGMDAATRTKVIQAFCQTIKNSGYTAGIYANRDWLTNKFHVNSLGGFKIWYARYAAAPGYSGRYEMWQYSSTGKISGINGNVDLNTSYMSY